ncbi:MAG: glycosyltransferase N-terminal domain-containing protein [Sphingobacteriaceae bacterium]|nr:glycosyltransferase N-terminal domain-containing protein [Sphingobacteriaceae bacterium]
MQLLYNFGIWLYGMVVRLLALFGHAQAQRWVAGRQNIWKALEKLPQNRKLIWFHTASAGEFEQGRPLIEAYRTAYPTHLVLISFFSPSGYELRKNYSGADLICYLPEDKPALVKRWLEIVRPSLAIFVKYEFWFHHYTQLKTHNIPLLLVSAPFRPNQAFFNWPTQAFWGKMLAAVKHFYVQDTASAQLLTGLGYQNVSICGDTRLDRVLALPKTRFSDPILTAFSQGQSVLVAGSTWAADEKILSSLLQMPGFEQLKLLIVPHEIKAGSLARTTALFNANVEVYSQTHPEKATHARVLVLDTMGMLSKVYRYGQAAYVGGGFGKGIHNLLEPAVYGIPVFFGPKNQKFLEAAALQKAHIGFEINSVKALTSALQPFLTSETAHQELRAATTAWFAAQAGATNTILADIRQMGL